MKVISCRHASSLSFVLGRFLRKCRRATRWNITYKWSNLSQWPAASVDITTRPPCILITWRHLSKSPDDIVQGGFSSGWASYQIRKIAGCACAGNAGNIFPRRRFQRKPLVSDPGMHHGTCVTHVPWCMSESLTCGDGENVTGIPGACAPAILRIWQEAHGMRRHTKSAR